MGHSDSPSRSRLPRSFGAVAAALIAALLVLLAGAPNAHAVPAFARKYKTSCTTCHTIYPMLNPFGEAFRRDGFRFPSQNGSLDSDSVQAEMLPLGRASYKKVFPRADWPDSITQGVPLGLMVNGGVHYNLPNTDAKAADGHAFAWNDLVEEFHIYAAGAFNNTLTYFTEVTLSEDGVDIEHAGLFWNDIVGPRHLVNLSVGHWAPTLDSWGMHSSYLADMQMPMIAVGSLYNMTGPDDTPEMALGHPDLIEVHGIAGHRFDYSLGWAASGAADGLPVPNSQDAYAHIGVKFGGMSLDGEGGCGAVVPDPMKPWAETSLGLDVYGYHGLYRVDSGVDPNNPTAQDDQINVLGGVARLQLGSLMVTGGASYEHHSQPYQGTPAQVGPPAVAGVADTNSGQGISGFGEIDYVVYPWLVPAVRVEYTHLSLDAAHGGGSAHLLRVMPGVATLIRPNIKVVLTGDLESAHGIAPASWGMAGGAIAPNPDANKTEFEQINADVAWAF